MHLFDQNICTVIAKNNYCQVLVRMAYSCRVIPLLVFNGRYLNTECHMTRKTTLGYIVTKKKIERNYKEAGKELQSCLIIWPPA